MESIYVTKITKLSAKKHIKYPMVRFPSEMGYLIGKTAVIHKIDDTHFLVEIKENVEDVENFKTINPKRGRKKQKANYKESLKNTENPKGCGGPDSNRRTPAGPDPESGAFDLARQPPPKKRC